MAKTKAKLTVSVTLESLTSPTPWPQANARLLGLGLGLPVEPLARLAQFSAPEFERLILEWATEYLAKLGGVYEVQQRGGAGDKGRDIVVWHDPPTARMRRWTLYQAKHYDDRLGTPEGGAEIGKVLHYTLAGDYTSPEQYFFVTHRGVTSTLQDLLDNPENMRKFILESWDKYCANAITSRRSIALTPQLISHINAFDFSIFRAKQPIDLIKEHAQTRFHLTVFGLPLINRPKPPTPPSLVAPSETKYVRQLYAVIGEDLGIPVHELKDFVHADVHIKLFDRSRITFYCAEGLRELARDQMADTAFFDTLLDEFSDGLYHSYSAPGVSGLLRLRS